MHCGVLGCAGHAARDAISHKWKCTPTVVAEVAQGAGIDAELGRADEVIQSVDEFRARYPRFATAAEADYQYFRSGEGEGALGAVRGEYAPEADWAMLALAVALGVFLTRDVPVESLEETGGGLSQVLPRRLAAIVDAVR